MGRRACSCPDEHRWRGLPHVEGCPRHVDRTPSLRVKEAVLARHGDVHEWLTYQECWRIDVFALRARAGGVGYRRVAYEVKVSRGDFLSEVRRPAKRRLALDLSHQFFFAVPEGLVTAAEVEVRAPECGLVYVSGKGRTRVVRKAVVREPREFTMAEIVYLARMPMYREKIDVLRHEVSSLRWAMERSSLTSAR